MLVEHNSQAMMQSMDLETLDLRQLDAFAAVMSAGSITGAARLLGRSQPAVTRLIQDLEANLGFELLHRNGPRITPTDQGILFHDEVERLLVGLKHIADRAQAIAKRQIQTIEIAAIPALAAGIIPQALARIDPGLVPHQLHLRSSAAEHVVQAVSARTADLGVASLPIEHPGIEVHWIAEVPCVAVLPENDPLARSDVIALKDLASRPLVTMANPYRLRRRVDEALTRAGVKPERIIDTNASFTALGAARAGVGIALVEPATAYGTPVQGLAVRPLDVHIPFLFGAFTPAAKPVSPTVQALIGALEQIAMETLPGCCRHDLSGRDGLAQAVYGSATLSEEPDQGTDAISIRAQEDDLR
jgi:DNA-binding transcriptional LysR family regulator